METVSAAGFRKPKTAVFLQPLKHNARMGHFFPSLPLASHIAPAVSITAVRSQREQYICRQDQVLNRPREPLNPSRRPSTGLDKAQKPHQTGQRSPIQARYPPIDSEEDARLTWPNRPPGTPAVMRHTNKTEEYIPKPNMSVSFGAVTQENLRVIS